MLADGVFLFIFYATDFWAMAGGRNIHFILIIPQIKLRDLKAAPGNE